MFDKIRNWIVFHVFGIHQNDGEVAELEKNISKLLEDNERVCEKSTDRKEQITVQAELIDELQEQLQDQIEKSKDPRFVLSCIIEGGIEWYDFEELKPEQKKNYIQHAKLLLRNPVLNNEINFMTQNYGKLGLEKADSDGALKEMQISALSIEAIRTRIECIVPPEEKEPEPAKDPFGGI